MAWTLEEVGCRAGHPAWGFVSGTNFVDFMDRGVRESVALIAVRSHNYARSRCGRMQWQAAFRVDLNVPER
ncbi:toll/interleukin-1 receptor domain-containing protein [Streptomyces acidicola]|uniref:toll/interleukin-1 receptor domain-containing protein n=1 Tax=Streptomyces acidicola TaxID=2596892 RepID=UPI0037AA5AF6